MHDHLLSGLTTRRAELAGEAAAIRARLAEIVDSLTHIDAVLREFDPTYEVGTIQPKRPRLIDAASPGERSRLVLDILRRAGEPLAVKDVVRLVLAGTAQGDVDLVTRQRITRRTEAVLARQGKRGVLRAVRGMGPVVLWEVAR